MTETPSNLTMHRAGPNVWDRQARDQSRYRLLGNIGFLLIAVGTLLVGEAYRERFASMVGSRVGPVLGRGSKNMDAINKASEESFPASDPPAFTPAVGKPAQAERR
jgi:hypothetical protein